MLLGVVRSVKSCYSIVGLVCLFCSLHTNLAASVRDKIDSLNALLQTTENAADSVHYINQLGYEYWTVEPLKSVSYGRQALKMATALEDRTEIAFSYRVIGVAYWALGDYPIALQNILISLDHYKDLGDERGIASMELNSALVFAEQGNYQQAKAHLKRGRKRFESLGVLRSVATTKTKLASILTEQDSLTKALKLLQEAIQQQKEANYTYGLTEAYNRLGVLYRHQGDYIASLDYLYQARDLSTSIADVDGLAKSLSDLGYTKLDLKQYEDAISFFEQSLEVASSISSRKWRLHALNGLSQVYMANGETQEALSFLQKHQELRDSLLSEQQIIAVSNLLEEFESRKQLQSIKDSQQEIALLEERATQKNYLLLLGILLSAAILYLFFLRIRFYRLQSSEKELALAAEKATSEQLSKELELSQRELTSYALNFIQKNEFLEELRQELRNIAEVKDARKLANKLQLANTLDSEWDKFRSHFEKVHGSFFETLKEKHPKLNQNELRHCALLRINLNTKECAAMLGISVEGAKTARYRLKKKLNLDAESSLFDYLLQLDK